MRDPDQQLADFVGHFLSELALERAQSEKAVLSGQPHRFDEYREFVGQIHALNWAEAQVKRQVADIGKDED